MSKYLSIFLASILVSLVISTPVFKNDNYESLQEVHYPQDPKPNTPLVRTIRHAEQGSQQAASNKSGKSGSKAKTQGNTDIASTSESDLQSTQTRSETNQPEQQGDQFIVGSSLNQELASQLQGFNENTDVSARSSQDLLQQESQQEPRTSHLLNHLGHGSSGSYGGGFGNSYSFGGGADYGITYQEPTIQNVVHQKPVLFHQEVIKPIVHEIVKPLPVFHETVKPIIHEVVKTLPVVKEVIKPVPVVHEILKPYTVPVVHPVQFHHQPTQINVPMQWSCQLVPGPGGPAVSGIQNGYGSYGSISSGLGGGYSQGGSYGLSGGFGLSNGGSIGLGGIHGSQGTYSLPIKTLPPKYIGGHGHKLFKSNGEAKESMQDDIQDMIQREELQYSSMGPSETNMRSMSQENPQLFAKMIDSMNQKRTNLNSNMKSNIFDFQPSSFQGMMPMRPQRLSSEQIQKMRMTAERNQQKQQQQPLFEQMSMRPMASNQMEQMPWMNIRSANNMLVKEVPREEMRTALMGMAQMPFDQRAIQIPINQMRAAEMEQMPLMDMRSNNMQQGPIEIRAAEMGMEPMSFNQMRAAEMGMEPMSFNQMRAAEMGMEPMSFNQMRAAEMEQMSLMNMRSANMDMQQVPMEMKAAHGMDPMLFNQRAIQIPMNQLKATDMKQWPWMNMRSANMNMQQSPMEMNYRSAMEMQSLPVEMRSAERSMQVPAIDMRTAQVSMQQIPVQQKRAAEMGQNDKRSAQNAEMNTQ